MVMFYHYIHQIFFACEKTEFQENINYRTLHANISFSFIHLFFSKFIFLYFTKPSIFKKNMFILVLCNLSLKGQFVRSFIIPLSSTCEMIKMIGKEFRLVLRDGETVTHFLLDSQMGMESQLLSAWHADMDSSVCVHICPICFLLHSYN